MRGTSPTVTGGARVGTRNVMVPEANGAGPRLVGNATVGSMRESKRFTCMDDHLPDFFGVANALVLSSLAMARMDIPARTMYLAGMDALMFAMFCMALLRRVVPDARATDASMRCDH